MNPCIEEELDIILGHAACELVNLSNSNISEPVGSKFEDMIKKLVKMTHHTSDKIRTKLSKKRDEIVFSLSSVHSTNCEESKWTTNSDAVTPLNRERNATYTLSSPERENE